MGRKITLLVTEWARNEQKINKTNRCNPIGLIMVFAFLFNAYTLNIFSPQANQVPARGGDLGVGHILCISVQCLHIEQEMHYIAVFNDVLLTLDADFSCIAASLLRAKCHIISILDNLGTYKTLLEIGVDNACCLRSLRTARVGPSTRLVGTRSEECFEVEQAVSRFD